MKFAFSSLPLAARAALLTALAVGSSHAATVTYDFTVPGVGSGSFQYDDANLANLGGGSYTSPLIGFSFAFNGWTYTLADSSFPGSDLVWFLDPAVALAGIQYQGAHALNAIGFTAGFGGGDMGTFTANGGAIGPIALTGADFTRQGSGGPAGVPEPGTLACVLLGLGLGRFGGSRRARKRKQRCRLDVTIAGKRSGF